MVARKGETRVLDCAVNEDVRAGGHVSGVPSAGFTMLS